MPMKKKKELPIYRVAFTGTKKSPTWAVLRPDGSKTNESDYPTKRMAEIWLERYVGFGYCKLK